MKHEIIDNLSSHNKERILGSKKCGCYYCLKKFASKEITKWIDYGETALCPRCGIDSVVDLEDFDSVQATKELQKMNEEYFSYHRDYEDD